MSSHLSHPKTQNFPRAYPRTPNGEIDFARLQHEAEARAGNSFRSLAQVAAGIKPTQRSAGGPVGFNSRNMRRQGWNKYGQAWAMVAHASLDESDPDLKAQADDAVAILSRMAGKPRQLEFNLQRGGYVIIGHQYHDAMRDRLITHGGSSARRSVCQTVLWEIIRWLEWENPVCRYNATQISKLLKISPGPMGRFLKILESPEIGAIVRKRVGRVMVILVNPEGAWRGYLDNHPKALAHFRAQVESMPSYRRRSSRDLGTANPTPTGG